MSGIYIHIPFCKRACHYCDFHFSTNSSQMEVMVSAICKELELRKDFLGSDQIIKTVYFGGGTPSLVPTDLLKKIMQQISTYYETDLEEVTLEANPDDLSDKNLEEWKALGIDRLSIGIQTFDENVLRFYNRAHTREESLLAIQRAKAAGFGKLSIDLIYGFPAMDHGIFLADLDIALEQDPGHISSYCLTVEPKTVLGNWEMKGKFQSATEDFAAEQFEILLDRLEGAGYIQYEISNFGKPGNFALHNTNYWKSVPYLGIGPSAHSYDGKNRGANIANNARYIRGMENGPSPYTAETLAGADRVNEYILTSLRTIWGLDINLVSSLSGVDFMAKKAKLLDKLYSEQLVLLKDNHLFLTRKGKFLADSIAASLFIG
ncbi:radical SAM family heme chaperone HemW [Mariniradius sediminis]|uniref:Heme chaperone HemW n=1 Tax=Mariniradius sediminis TaxID=2909237 RepID=A0ABS9BPE5_9BACT|nr:radical SAM family heme chaperone HemW [Mariniradius sediminis]MCF1749542.1 radical SAM family heme chaperone HemW [Mariniradius sediminis]